MLTKMQKIVLSYPKLKERIENRENPDKERQKALKNLDEVRAEFSPATIKTFLKFLDATLPKLALDIPLLSDDPWCVESSVLERSVSRRDFSACLSYSNLILVADHR